MWDGIEDILRRKAAEGVDVRLIYDDFGSLLGLPKDFVVRMERAHIRCIPFNPVVPLVSLVMNHRDHRKIVVIDGNVAYTGGVNLADEYINAEQRFGYWKDAALRIEGAAVWNFTGDVPQLLERLPPQRDGLQRLSPQPRRLPDQSDGVVQPYADSPLDEEPLAETVYLNILAQAQQYVYIYTPYLRRGRGNAGRAAKRGQARGGCPAGAAGHPGQEAGVPAEPVLLSAAAAGGGAHLRVHPGFLHAKCYVSDDRAAVVGSINMDYRSLFLHFECGALLLQQQSGRRPAGRCAAHPAAVPGGAGLADCRTVSAGHAAGQRAAAAEPPDVKKPPRRRDVEPALSGHNYPQKPPYGRKGACTMIAKRHQRTLGLCTLAASAWLLTACGRAESPGSWGPEA